MSPDRGTPFAPLTDRTVYAQELLSWSHLLDTVVMSFKDYMVDREEEDARILKVA